MGDTYTHIRTDWQAGAYRETVIHIVSYPYIHTDNTSKQGVIHTYTYNAPYIRTCIHASRQACIHTYIHIYIYTKRQSCTHTYIHTYRLTHRQAYTQ